MQISRKRWIAGLLTVVLAGTAQLELHPTRADRNPAVAVMDLHVGNQVVSVMSATHGSASVYFGNGGAILGMRFYLRTPDGTFTVDVPQAELEAGTHVLSPSYAAAKEVWKHFQEIQQQVDPESTGTAVLSLG